MIPEKEGEEGFGPYPSFFSRAVFWHSVERDHSKLLEELGYENG